MFKRLFFSTLLIVFLMIALASSWGYMKFQAALEHPDDTVESLTFEQWEAKEFVSTGDGYLSTQKNGSDVLRLSDLKNPSEMYQPWTRWWWPGALVELSSLDKQLDEIKSNGFSGVEIQPFTMGTDGFVSSSDQDEMRSIDSQTFYNLLSAFLTSADQKGISVELTNGSGWPAGGPHISSNNSLKTLAFGLDVVSLKETTFLNLELPKAKPNANEFGNFLMELFLGQDVANFDSDSQKLVAVLAGRIQSGELSSNPLVINDSVQLDRGSVVDVTEFVKNGSLKWQAGEGRWAIIPIYLAETGEAPVLGATQAPGFVLDHLDKDLLAKHYDYTLGSRTGLEKHWGRSLAGVFNDSLEFKVNRLTSDDIIQQFKTRRGYELTPYLPILFFDAADNFYLTDSFLDFSALPNFSYGDNDSRVRYDYQLTLSDLMIERFIEGSYQWLDKRKMQSRGQSYGMDLDVIRALGANHVPETEQLYGGGSNAFLKMAGAAGALYKRNTVSAESFVWSGKDYMSTPFKLKVAVDKLFASGINRVIYHGTTYKLDGQTTQAMGSAWFPWSSPSSNLSFSSDISSSSRFWPNIKELNEYISRSQYLLRQGKPDYDVFIYYPFLGFPSKHERDPNVDGELLINGHLPNTEPELESLSLPLVGQLFPSPEPDPRNEWLKKVTPLIYEIEKQGLTWTWTNEHAIGSGLLAQGHPDSVVVLAETESISASFSAQLLEHKVKTSNVFLLGTSPTRQRGLANFRDGDKVVAKNIASIKSLCRQHCVHNINEFAKHVERLNEDELAMDGVDSIDTAHFPVKKMRRRLGQGSIVFYSNQSDSDIQLRVKSGSDHFWWNPIEGELFTSDSKTISLKPYAAIFQISNALLDDVEDGLAAAPAMFQQFEDKAIILSNWQYLDSEGSYQPISGPLAPSHQQSLRDHSGEINYRAEFEVDLNDHQQIALSTKAVNGVVDVKINGNSSERWNLPPYVIDISKYTITGRNEIEFRVLPADYNERVTGANSGNSQLAHFRSRPYMKKVGLSEKIKLSISTK